MVRLACKERRNVFYTGPGGVGKSFVTSVIVSFLRQGRACPSTLYLRPSTLDPRPSPLDPLQVYLSGFSKAVAITAKSSVALSQINA